MANLPIINNLRVVPRDAEFLDRKTGARGEIFYDKDNNTIRLYDSNVVGGLPLARGDLTNVTNAIFAAKATAAGVGGGSGSGSNERIHTRTIFGNDGSGGGDRWGSSNTVSSSVLARSQLHQLTSDLFAKDGNSHMLFNKAGADAAVAD